MLALCVSSVLGYRQSYSRSYAPSAKKPYAARYTNADSLYYDADFDEQYYDDDYVEAVADDIYDEMYLMYEEAAENLERAQREFALMSRMLDAEQQSGEVAQKEEFVWLLWSAAKEGAKKLAKEAIKKAIKKAVEVLVKKVISKWVTNKIGKTASKAAVKEACKKYFKKYKAYEKIKKKVSKALRKTTSKVTDKMIEAELDKLMDSDLKKLENKLNEEATKERIETAVEKKVGKYVDEKLKSTWWDLVPGVGEAKLIKDVYDILGTNEINQRVEKAVDEEIQAITDEIAPDE